MMMGVDDDDGDGGAGVGGGDDLPPGESDGGERRESHGQVCEGCERAMISSRGEDTPPDTVVFPPSLQDGSDLATVCKGLHFTLKEIPQVEGVTKTTYFWCVCGGLLLHMFEANFLSSLLKPNYGKFVDTAEDIIGMGLSVQKGPNTAQSTVDRWKNSTSLIIRQLAERTIIPAVIFIYIEKIHFNLKFS